MLPVDTGSYKTTGAMAALRFSPGFQDQALQVLSWFYGNDTFSEGVSCKASGFSECNNKPEEFFTFFFFVTGQPRGLS